MREYRHALEARASHSDDNGTASNGLRDDLYMLHIPKTAVSLTLTLTLTLTLPLPLPLPLTPHPHSNTSP